MKAEKYKGSASYRVMNNSRGLTIEDIDIIKKSLSNHFLFTNLTERIVVK